MTEDSETVTECWSPECHLVGHGLVLRLCGLLLGRHLAKTIWIPNVSWPTRERRLGAWVLDFYGRPKAPILQRRLKNTPNTCNKPFDIDCIVGRNICLSLLGRRSLVAGLVDRLGRNYFVGIHFWTLHGHYGRVDIVHALCLQLPFK